MGSKSLITTIVIIVVIVAGIFLWRGVGMKSVSTSPTGEATPATEAGGQTNDQAVSGQTGSIGKMTDDIYVEMIVQAAYQAQKNPAAYAANMQTLYAKYGITAENITAYGESLQKDPARTQTIMQKYTKKLQELQGQ
jgi:hypothetical protein